MTARRRLNEPYFSHSMIFFRLTAASPASIEQVTRSLHFTSARQSTGISENSMASSPGGSPCHSQSGPQCHNLLAESSIGVKPRDGISAGLLLPGQCLQQLAGKVHRSPTPCSGQIVSTACLDQQSSIESPVSPSSMWADQEKGWVRGFS